MTTPSIHRFDVVERMEAFDIIATAIAHGQNAELTLMNETGLQKVSFRITATDHNRERHIGTVFGVTADNKSINVVFERNANDKLEAVQATIG